MKKIILGLIGIGVLGLGFLYFNSKNNVNATYTLDDISKHATKEDCWMAIEGKVYNVTPFIASGMHKGKDAILMGCGKDATSLFNNRPNGSGAHSKLARSMMVKFAIGTLK